MREKRPNMPSASLLEHSSPKVALRFVGDRARLRRKLPQAPECFGAVAAFAKNFEMSS
jgi:hypothetical protein